MHLNRKIFALFATIFISVSSLTDGIQAQSCCKLSRADAIAAKIKDPSSRDVIVVSHRGDWRNWPENSLPAMKSVIDMGVDVLELDLKLTKDSVLMVCHDTKIDRTTNGKGKVSDMTYDSIQNFVLLTGHGIKTQFKMPTLKEALSLCKDKIVVNIDKGYEYYDLALAVCEELGVTDQVLIKGKSMPDVVAEKFGSHPHNMMYMPIIDIQKPHGKKLYDAYLESGTVPLAYEICWDTFTPEVDKVMKDMVASGSKLWVNSLWPSLNGGWCDDAAFTGDPEDIYGKLVNTGATIIQTDRPQLLISYLRKHGLHE